MINPRRNYIVDTNFFIAYFRSEPKAVAAYAKLRQNQVFLSAYTYFELMEGEYFRAPGRVGAMKIWLDNFTAIPFNTGVALVAARHQARQKKNGMTVVPESDLIIGATAVHMGFSLLTRNVEDYRSFVKPEKLDLVDWADS